MGSSQSCNLCSPDESSNKNTVIIMTENGEAMELKSGTKVHEVLAAHPFHKVIRCCSDRTVLSENYTLNCNSLYFLLPQGLSISDATYRSLVNSAISKQLISIRPAQASNNTTTNMHSSNTTKSTISSSDCEIDNEYMRVKLSPWKPRLITIPEGISPSPPPTRQPADSKSMAG